MGLLEIATIALEGVKQADSAGFIDLKQMFSIPGTPTPSGEDPEYEMNVERTMNQQVAYAQKAVDQLGIENPQNPYFAEIESATRSALSEWGSKGNYTRNVANPDAFYSKIDSIIRKAKDNELSFSDDDTPIATQYDQRETYSVNSYFDTANEQPSLERTGEQDSGNKNVNQYSGMAIIGIIVLIMLMFFKK